MGIQEIIRQRDAARQAEALPLAAAALRALREAGIEAWLVGSLARGDFRQHSDIDILIDAPSQHRTQAIRLCLAALRGFPSSIVFKEDDPEHAAIYFSAEASNEPRIRV